MRGVLLGAILVFDTAVISPSAFGGLIRCSNSERISAGATVKIKLLRVQRVDLALRFTNNASLDLATVPMGIWESRCCAYRR